MKSQFFFDKKAIVSIGFYTFFLQKLAKIGKFLMF